MRRTLRILCLLWASLELTAPHAWGQDRPKDTPEQTRLKKFWTDYGDSLGRYFRGREAAQVAGKLSESAPPPAAPCNH